jgi:hypothetical protein
VCRILSVDHYFVADFVEAHSAVELAPQRAVAGADDAAPAVATAHPQELTAVLLSLLLLVRLPQEAWALARLLDLGLCRVLAARAKYLRAVLMAELSRRDELVCHLQMVQVTCVLRLPRALPLLRPVDAHQARLFAQPVLANRLTRAPLLHRDPHGPLYLQEARLPDRDLRLLDLFLDLAPGCLPRERQHELAAECSLDFQL